jgi:hypothetical protein
LKKDSDATVGCPSADAVAGDVSEEERVVEPYGTFGPGEACRDLFELSVQWNDSIR